VTGHGDDGAINQVARLEVELSEARQQSGRLEEQLQVASRLLEDATRKMKLLEHQQLQQARAQLDREPTLTTQQQQRSVHAGRRAGAAAVIEESDLKAHARSREHVVRQRARTEELYLLCQLQVSAGSIHHIRGKARAWGRL